MNITERNEVIIKKAMIKELRAKVIYWDNLEKCNLIKELI